MRLITFEAGGKISVGVKTERGVADTGISDMLTFINIGDEAIRLAEEASVRGNDLSDYRLLAPIRPGKLLFMGINYRSHLDENPTGVLPAYPHFFSKLPSAVIGPNENIVIPDPSYQVDYEVELAVIIGKKASKVNREDALDYVFGYTVANDVSARAVQFADNQITTGKGFDTFCPLGPEIVTADEIGDPSKLRLATFVNGEKRQDSATDQMLFDVATVIEFLSRNITLYPGDLISTGTPAGVGYFFNPPDSYLKPGDVVNVSIDKIGQLTNGVVAGW